MSRTDPSVPDDLPVDLGFRWSRRTRWFVFLGVPLGFLLLGFLATRDEPPPADQDLKVVRRQVPEEANGFGLLDIDPDGPWSEAEVSVLGGAEEFDREGAQEFLKAGASLLDRYDAIGERPELCLPESPAAMDHKKQTGYLLACRGLAYLALSRQRLLFETGKEREAFMENLKLLRYGRRVQEAQGEMIDYLVGLAIQDMALANTCRFATRTRIEPGELKSLLAALEALGPSEDGWRDSLRGQYEIISCLASDVARGDMERHHQVSLPTFGHEFLARTLFKPNQARRLLGEEIRFLIAAVGKTQAETGRRDGREYQVIDYRFLKPTKNLVFFEASVLHGMFDKARLGTFHHHAARVLLAARCFLGERGRLPVALDDLVPGYLPGVPRDPFDGKPLRYSLEHSVIYSVGTDLIDSGGSDEEDDHEALRDLAEPTCRMGL